MAWSALLDINVYLIWVLHVISTFFMLGFIWFTQVVHYPLLSEVSQYKVAAYEFTRMRLTTWVVAPPMVVEIITGAILVWRRPAQLPVEVAWLGMGLILVIWLSTAVLQAPKHTILARGYDERAHRALIISNWIRTIVWTLRGILLSYFLLLILMHR